MERKGLPLGKKIFFATAILIVFLALAEIGLRAALIILGNSNSAYSLRSVYDSYERYNPEYVTELVPGYTEYGGGDASPYNKELRLAINSNGFRGAEFETPKKPNTVRIMALGDSTTFGLRPEDCPYPAQLGALFKKNPLYQNIEVINAGIEGNDSGLALKRLKHLLLPHEPDIILIAVGWNDLYKQDPQAPYSAPRYQTFWRILNKSYLVKALRRLIFRELKPRLVSVTPSQSGTPPKEYSEFQPTLFIENLEAMIQLSREKGVTPILMTLPSVLSTHPSQQALSLIHYPHFTNNPYALFALAEAYNDAIRIVATREKVALIDNDTYFNLLDQAIAPLSGARGGGSNRALPLGGGDLPAGRQARAPIKESYFTDTLHLTCPGYGLIAENIFQELTKNAIILRK